VLPGRKGRLVVFVDEIDSVRSLPFSTDEFFAGIREFYNRRSEEPELERLTFCLLGVATPSDLIRDTRTTPFNIGERIELTDFMEEDAGPLTEGLGRGRSLAKRLLRRVLYWTGGHPYLTQRLCQAVAADTSVMSDAGVDALCEKLFFSSRAKERDTNLHFVRERLLSSETDLATLLHLYLRVLDNNPVLDDEANPQVNTLRLSGITRVVEGRLRVRNRIYEQVFDHAWAMANMPDAELRRQREAYRSGVRRATAIAIGLSFVTIFLIGLAFSVVSSRTAEKQHVYRYTQLMEEVERLNSENVRLRTRYDEQLGRVYRLNQEMKIEFEEIRRQLKTGAAGRAK
jgi:hypothetical protein